MQKNLDLNFNEKFLESYRQEESDPIDKGHQFDGESVADAQVMNPASAEAKQLAESVMNSDAKELMAFGYPVVDFIQALLPNGVPINSRHTTALKLASDLLILCDGATDQVRALLLQQPWVRDIVAERGIRELDGIMDAAQKRKFKRESEQINDLQPSRDMQRAIKQVTGRKYNALVREAHKQLMSNGITDGEDDIIQLLERIGKEIEKLFPYFPVLKLLCHRQKRKHYIAALFVGGSFCMTLSIWTGLNRVMTDYLGGITLQSLIDQAAPQPELEDMPVPD